MLYDARAATVSAPLDHSVKNILIVDDDSSIPDVLRRALVGYRIWIAREPYEALQIAASLASLDLLITDYMMPAMMGDELIGRLRERLPSVKIIVLTGVADILDQENPEWWARETHLSKPINLGTLRQTVAGLIGPPTGP